MKLLAGEGSPVLRMSYGNGPGGTAACHVFVFPGQVDVSADARLQAKVYTVPTMYS